MPRAWYKTSWSTTCAHTNPIVFAKDDSYAPNPPLQLQLLLHLQLQPARVSTWCAHAQLDELFRLADADGDGTISKPEFVQCVRPACAAGRHVSAPLTGAGLRGATCPRPLALLRVCAQRVGLLASPLL